MSDEPGFGPETHSTHEPTPEEVAARRSVPAGSSRSPADMLRGALTGLQRLSEGAEDANLYAMQAALHRTYTMVDEATAALVEQLERLTEERDMNVNLLAGMQTVAEGWKGDLRDAQAENARLSSQLESTREGLREIEELRYPQNGEWSNIVDLAQHKARALLAVSSRPSGDTEGEQT